MNSSNKNLLMISCARTLVACIIFQNKDQKRVSSISSYTSNIPCFPVKKSKLTKKNENKNKKCYSSKVHNQRNSYIIDFKFSWGFPLIFDVFMLVPASNWKSQLSNTLIKRWRKKNLKTQNHTWVLPTPGGPTNSVRTPNGIPPPKDSSNPLRRVGRWPAMYSSRTLCSISDSAYKHSDCNSHFLFYFRESGMMGSVTSKDSYRLHRWGSDFTDVCHCRFHSRHTHVQ